MTRSKGSSTCAACGATWRDKEWLFPGRTYPISCLGRNVVDAVRAGIFQVYAIDTIDQGIEILTGVSAGERDAEGKFPEGSINRKVEARLIEFAEKRLASRRKMPPESEL